MADVSRYESSTIRLLTVRHVALRLNVSERTVRHWANIKVLRSRRAGKLHRFHPDDIERFLESCSPLGSDLETKNDQRRRSIERRRKK